MIANFETVECVCCHDKLEMLEPVDTEPLCDKCDNMMSEFGNKILEIYHPLDKSKFTTSGGVKK